MTHATRQADPDAPAEASAPVQPAKWLAGFGIVVAALLLVWQFSFLDYSRALVDLWKISDGGATGFVVYTAAIATLTAAWLWSVWTIRGVALSQIWLPIAGITLLALVAFMIVYPATAIDVYIYAARSHLFSDYGLNPTTVVPQQLWDTDAYVHYASAEWADDTSPYGPLWNVIAAPATALDGNDIESAVLIFKVIMMAGTAAVGILIYRIGMLIQPQNAVAAMLAWLWSPIVLWEGIANSHNDVLLMLLIVAAMLCWYRRLDGWVLPLLGAAALLKIVAVMIIPAAAIAIVIRTGWTRRLLVVAVQSAILSLGVLWISFVPFYDLQATIDAVQEQRGVWVTSPALLIDAMNREWGWGLDVGQLFDSFSTAMIVLITMVGAAVAYLNPERLPRIAFEQLFWFLLLATSNVRPWYAIWLIALAVAIPLGMPFIRAAALSTGMLFSYVYSGWIQNWSDAEWLERTALNVTIMLGPVLVVTAWSGVRMLRSGRNDPAVTISTPTAG
ncbi:MAG TPA: hypothetical protein VD789_03665 [Thermomicrobiales bacterium]|nr:hypothetical protein [Thermomicrobiales bacterium]